MAKKKEPTLVLARVSKDTTDEEIKEIAKRVVARLNEEREKSKKKS